MINKADYDLVGAYSQDEINGLTDALLEKMIDLIDPQHAIKILEAMGGDGNFLLRLFNYCKNRNIEPPHCTLFELSKIQTKFAREKLPTEKFDVICGDILTLISSDEGKRLEKGVYDRVIIKSSNHEIPLECQQIFYQHIFELLQPGGYFINLGFLFNNQNERDEVRKLAAVKDELAGMKQAQKNRYFMMRDELYKCLEAAGFINIQAKINFDYHILSKIVAEYYFDKNIRDDLNIKNQAAQIYSVALRRNERIQFIKDESLLILPGEITIAYKP